MGISFSSTLFLCRSAAALDHHHHARRVSFLHQLPFLLISLSFFYSSTAVIFLIFYPRPSSASTSTSYFSFFFFSFGFLPSLVSCVLFDQESWWLDWFLSRFLPFNKMEGLCAGEMVWAHCSHSSKLMRSYLWKETSWYTLDHHQSYHSGARCQLIAFLSFKVTHSPIVSLLFMFLISFAPT